ncbi:MAG: M20/M25/M40 family metallo-hydrolase [Opitutales bacterium]
MPTPLPSILEVIPDWRERLEQIREIILANAVMFGEIPAPTFGEERRIRFLSDRFTEAGLSNVSIDEAGNGMAILPGKSGDGNILVLAHADTVFAEVVDHAMSVGPDRITGPGIGDNSLGLAAVASLPTLLEQCGIELEHNLMLMGAVKSLGRGDLGGMRFFLEHNAQPIAAGVCVEGVHLGRLSFASLGMLRGEINVQLPEDMDWSAFTAKGAIVILNDIINKLLAVPLPSQPRTSIVLGSVNAGTSYNTRPLKAQLRFEVRSIQEGQVRQVQERIEEIIDEVRAETEAEVRLEVLARRRPGGLAYGHPLVKGVRGIMDRLGIEPKIAPSTGELSELIVRGVPGVTLGLTTGEKIHDFTESVDIEPVYKGLAQLIATIKAIDEGICDG